MAHCQPRYPSYFGILRFDKYEVYGVLEILQNIMLDFKETSDNYKERWAVYESLVFILETDRVCELSRYVYS